MKSAEKYGIGFSLIIMIVGSFFYFALAESTVMDEKEKAVDDKEMIIENSDSVDTLMDTTLNGEFKEGVNMEVAMKVAYTQKDEVKLFALARNNELGKLKAEKGNPIPEIGSVVIGSTEAEIMKKEALFSEPGDIIKDLFGVDVKVEGILEKTNSPLDELHFLSQEEFLQLNGENGRVYIKYVEGESKLFYFYPTYGNTPITFDLAEGDLEDYTTHILVGETYYPLIVGSREADIMRGENIFSKPGDIIPDFFGKKVIVVGILKETNTPLDIMHFVPIIEQGFDN